MAQTPEAKVKAKIKKFLKERGVYFFSPIGSAFGTHGVPDLVCCYKGLFVGIEVKAPGKLGTLTANQQAHLAKIKEAGGWAIVIDDVSKVVDLFDRLDLY